MIDHSKPWTAYCTAPKFAKKVGQRLRSKDGSIIVIVSVTRPTYIESEMRCKYTYMTRPASEEEARQAIDADAAALAAKAASTAAALVADDIRHANS